jgi:hypothetical protein
MISGHATNGHGLTLSVAVAELPVFRKEKAGSEL